MFSYGTRTQRWRSRLWRWCGPMSIAAVFLLIAGVLIVSLGHSTPLQPDAVGVQLPRVQLNAVDVQTFHGQGQLAFSWSGRLYMLDGQRDALYALPGTIASSNPEWSPDGEWLAYTVYTTQARHEVVNAVRVVRRDGIDAHQVAGPPSSEALGFTWLPRGHMLEIETSTSHGTGPAARCVDAGEGPATPCPVAGEYGSYSRDGKTLAYTKLLPNKDPLKRREELLTAQGGRTQVQVPAQLGSIDIVGWWPDGKGLLYRTDPQFSASLAADGLPLYSLRLGARPKALPVSLGYPDWMSASPSGRQVVLVSGGGRDAWHGKSLEICDLETAACHPPPSKQGTVSLDANWSPRGNQIAFVQARDLGPVDGAGGNDAFSAEPLPSSASWVRSRTLWVANTDGTGARRVAAAGTGVYDPQWSADGRHVLFVRDNWLWLIDVLGGPPSRVLGPFGSGWFSDYYGHQSWSEYWTWNRGTKADAYWSAPGAPLILLMNAPSPAQRR